MGYPHFSTDCIDFHDRVIDWGRKPREDLVCSRAPGAHHSFRHDLTEGTVEYWTCTAPLLPGNTLCGAKVTRATDSSFIPRGIITICGSGRFMDTMVLENQRLTREGYIVISLSMAKKDQVDGNPALHELLDSIHLRKIDLADMVYVIDVDGYVGDSTRSEIEYAQSRGKAVHYMSKGDLA